MKRRLLVLTVICIMILGTFSVGQSFAAVSASLSGGGTYKPGETVTMNLKFSGANFGAVEAQVSYDSSVLTFSSCSATYNTGSNTIVMSAASSPELSCTLTFKANAEGSTTVSVRTIEGATAELEPFSAGTSATVTVKKPAASSSSSSSSSSNSSSASKPSTSVSKPSSSEPSNNRAEFKEEAKEETPEEPPKRPEQFIVTVGDNKYVIIEDLKSVDLPVGFKVGTTEYDGWDVKAAINEEKGITLLYLKNNSNDEKQFFVYNKSSESFGQKVSIELNEYLEYLELKKAGESKTPIILAGVALVAALGAVGLQIARMKGFNPFKKVNK